MGSWGGVRWGCVHLLPELKWPRCRGLRARCEQWQQCQEWPSLAWRQKQLLCWRGSERQGVSRAESEGLGSCKESVGSFQGRGSFGRS